MAESDGVAGVDLRGLLDEAIAKIEPLLRSAAAVQAEPSTCSWCPICRAANAVKGHEQDLFASIATQGGALLTVLKDAVSGMNTTSAPKHAAPEATTEAAAAEFTEIPVTLKP